MVITTLLVSSFVTLIIGMVCGYTSGYKDGLDHGGRDVLSAAEKIVLDGHTVAQAYEAVRQERLLRAARESMGKYPMEWN